MGFTFWIRSFIYLTFSMDAGPRSPLMLKDMMSKGIINWLDIQAWVEEIGTVLNHYNERK